MTWEQVRSFNWWKTGFLALAAYVLLSGLWSAYWHVRWVDGELYRLKQNETAIVQWINSQSQRK